VVAPHRLPFFEVFFHPLLNCPVSCQLPLLTSKDFYSNWIKIINGSVATGLAIFLVYKLSLRSSKDVDSLGGCQLRFKEQTTVCQALIPNAIAVTKHPMNAQKTGSRNIDFMLTSALSREI